VVAILITRAETQITQLSCWLARRSNYGEPFVCCDFQTHLSIYCSSCEQRLLWSSLAISYVICSIHADLRIANILHSK